ncbi:MAG: hypothetical protein R3C01_11340 [Planctomycetaceae bacterium]
MNYAATTSKVHWTPTLHESLTALCLSTLLAFLFWFPLWKGGGLQGGDIYSYYMPQKVLLADSLATGELPLWNDVAGFGYPAVAESQTGILYLPNLVLYSLFSINTAYVVSQMGHYILAFLLTWGLSRQLGLSPTSAAIASLSFVYGWFPPRICLEWAIVGGMYFSGILWMGVAWLQTGKARYWGAMAALLGSFLTAGHFHLAFATLIAMTVLSVGSWFSATNLFGSEEISPQTRRRRAAWLMGGLILGFGIAAVQLIPSWELKQIGQRRSAAATFDPGYGHIPPASLTQLIAPWLWHGANISTDQLLEQPSFLRYPAATNRVEAHLYAGLIPMLLTLSLLIFRRQQKSLFSLWPWLVIGGTGLLLATGWPLVILKSLPGFGFFMGPGRYGILTAMTIAILAGTGWDRLRQSLPRLTASRLIVATVLLITSIDLWGVSREYIWRTGTHWGRQVFYAALMELPAISLRQNSSLATQLRAYRADARMYAPGANIPSISGVSSLPVYLGLGPEIYFEPDQQIDFTRQSPDDVDKVTRRLKEWGVTHLLMQERLSTEVWPVEPLLEVYDPVINRAMARPLPFFLYGLKDAPGRVRLTGDGEIESFDSTPNRVNVTYNARVETHMILADLNLTGWQVEVDGQPATMLPDETFRVLTVPAGRHQVTWHYRPLSIKLGLAVSCGSLLVLFWLARRLKSSGEDA